MRQNSEILQEIADRYIDSNLILAQSIGISRTYGKVIIYTKNHISSRMEKIKQDLEFIKQNLNNINHNNKTEYLENLIVKFRLEEELFEFSVKKSHEEDPYFYLSPLTSISATLTKLTYASFNTRINDIIEIERGAIGNLKIASENLKSDLSKVKIDLTKVFINGLKDYHQDELVNFISQGKNKELVEEWRKINEELITELNTFDQILTTQYLPHAKDGFALGKEKFLNQLKYSELVNLSTDELLEIAEHDLNRNIDSLESILQKKGREFLDEMRNDHPKSNNLLNAGSAAVKRTKQFVIDSDLVSIPYGEDVEVIESPVHLRATTFADISPFGFGEDTNSNESYYYITSPERDWSEERKNEYLKSFARGSLEMITIHEVWPGHFLHKLKFRGLKSKIIRQLAFSTTTLEGWAHYCEELAIELRYDKLDHDKVHVGQLLWALVRDCRFIASIKMHTQNMTVEEVTKLFMNKAYMSEDAALKEARRGTLDPMYLNYTLGKLMVLKLREDYKREKGDKFSLKEFHDDFLSYGAPPVTLLRELLLENPGGKSDIL